ncbi:thiamine phosphate synthase [Primorskyibacter sp. 2E107]|uniref:thiamine phosphate synthase n=1 Tax=Primorskyibacter sp. 2E107 TaxID=3403458 RepID=UPI003AF97D7E
MSAEDAPQIYLVTPPVFDLGSFPGQLARVIEGQEIACLRLSLATRDEDTLTRAADAVREVAHRFDVALVIDTHVVLSQRLGLDGVHLTDGARSVRAARKTLGPDAIVGAWCRQSRHEGLSAGEAGADYVSFGPVSGTLGDGGTADDDLFGWWSEMVEVPVVAEGGLTEARIRTLTPMTDFFAIGEEIWSTEDPLTTLKTLCAAMT